MDTGKAAGGLEPYDLRRQEAKYGTQQKRIGRRMARRAQSASGEGERTHLAAGSSGAERRELPWVKVEKDYVFDGPDGKETLADLFDGRSQLIVYHVNVRAGMDGRVR